MKLEQLNLAAETLSPEIKVKLDELNILDSQMQKINNNMKILMQQRLKLQMDLQLKQDIIDKSTLLQEQLEDDKKKEQYDQSVILLEQKKEQFKELFRQIESYIFSSK